MQHYGDKHTYFPYAGFSHFCGHSGRWHSMPSPQMSSFYSLDFFAACFHHLFAIHAPICWLSILTGHQTIKKKVEATTWHRQCHKMSKTKQKNILWSAEFAIEELHHQSIYSLYGVTQDCRTSFITTVANTMFSSKDQMFMSNHAKSKQSTRGFLW